MWAATQIIKSRYEERSAERSRIARELHDLLLQSLAGALLQLIMTGSHRPYPLHTEDRLFSR